MAGTVREFRWGEFVQLIPAVEAVGFEVLPPVDTAMVGVLKQPRFEGPSIRIELVHSPEDIQEHLLDGLLCFPIIVEDGAGDPEDQRTMPFK
jgi:hypothetical protein